MGKTAFIFPGQGAQYVGMGQDFYDKMPVCRQVIDKASQVSGLDIPKICFTENEEINITGSSVTGGFLMNAFTPGPDA